MTAFVVVNPTSRNGDTGRDWPKIRAALEGVFPLMTVTESHGRGETARLVRAALKDGHLDIIAVGGDGTINEAVNGFFENGAAVSPDAVFGFVSSGSGSDFRRTFGIAGGYEAAIARLKLSRIRRLDVGRVACVSAKGEPVSRYFVNVASFGFSGRLVSRINRARFAKLFGDGFARSFHALTALIGWRPQRVRLIADAGYDEIAGIANVAVANGRWFGGGLRVAPNAEPSDGLFDIVVMGGAPRRHILQSLNKIRSGAHLSDPGVRLVRASRLTAAPTVDTKGAVTVETDGESAGLLPATFEILAGAINLRC
jgi:YegS/Rv2252/BmrU family lipid kinase